MRTMRAIAIEEFGGPEKLLAMELACPRPKRGEVLVRVVSAGVNPVDWKIREGYLRDFLPHAFPLIPGWDVAGVVDGLGEGCGRFRKGDRVWAFARKPVVQGGCYAEYVTVPETSLASMPAKLLYEEAAAVPAAALTAYQCLTGRCGPGAAVLVHGAAGGVGHFAVQLAADAGAEVYGTAGPANQEFVLGLGATRAIDYTRDDFVEAVRRERPDGVDLVLDAVGGETLSRSYAALKPGGHLVGIVDEPDAREAAEAGVTVDRLIVQPDADHLEILTLKVDAKKLRPSVQKIFSLSEAAEAHKTVAGGHVRGKLVLNL